MKASWVSQISSAEILSALQRPPWYTLIRHFDHQNDDRALADFASNLGQISGDVYSVELGSAPLCDSEGAPLYSRLPSAFPCHTDGANRIRPYDIVILLCIRPDLNGGLTRLMTINAIIDALETSTVRLLRDQVYPFHFGCSAIIEDINGEMTIRYNRQDIDLYRRLRGVTIDVAHEKAISCLEKVLKHGHRLRTFALRANDCLIINNRKIVHGRSEISAGSNRLLKRVRMFMREI